jgi:hypothetical protein
MKNLLHGNLAKAGLSKPSIRWSGATTRTWARWRRQAARRSSGMAKAIDADRWDEIAREYF